MSILRVEKNSNYVVMNKTALHDKNLSWKAKGIIAYMLSMPDDWTFYIEELIKHSTDGEKAFRSGLKELKENGYVKRKPIREGNKITGWETIVSEVPNVDNALLADFVHVENVEVQNVHVQNEGLLSNDSLLNNDIKLNNEIYIVQFENFWSMYPRKEGKKKSKDKFIKLLKDYSFDQIMNGTEKYLNYLSSTKTKKQFIKQPLTFLNGEHFNDEYETYQNEKVTDYEYRNGELPF